ncbi:hypothetical protein MPTK1_1g29730 [Marchantia polymorpha subsp. ruderalis]|uniref:Uncharacterized protein n=2 Tax=Marchantia polymorpha TaxID=3197 RepID=A0AAF6AVN9_MARPO|nr:hypothetical protein MARPO_0139s0001 [Marchantia polymorpha]BBN00510.1 hypothetical protein Mp_1g29730 [Marchantia polymorpha subsp. ruderalis]|eukprot:PTQ29520.1 hypothetical protein MARPO_0139s0001 [Marchantia polymorpha]
MTAEHENHERALQVVLNLKRLGHEPGLVLSTSGHQTSEYIIRKSRHREISCSARHEDCDLPDQFTYSDDRFHTLSS